MDLFIMLYFSIKLLLLLQEKEMYYPRKKEFSPPKKNLAYHTCILNIANKLAKQERKFHLFPRYVTLPTGDTTTAVPVQKTSSALSNSSTDTRRSSTLQEANALVKTAFYWRQHMMS
jgi:hypothetical protein